MKHKVRLVILFVGAMHALTAASAGEPCSGLKTCPVPNCIGRWRCDDYCAKKAPCVCVPMCFRCDDYCPKKAPCVCIPMCFRCDDYCKKCVPRACSSPRCGATHGSCDCDSCDGTYDGLLTDSVADDVTTVDLAAERIATNSKVFQLESTEPSVPLPRVFVEKLPFGLVE